jgi:hypothetical protein
VACVARLRSGESATLSVTDECLFGTAIRDNAANSIQFHEDSRSLPRRIVSELSQVRWRAGRGTMHLPNSEGTTVQAVRWQGTDKRANREGLIYRSEQN